MIFFFFCILNVFNIFGQVNGIFPNIKLGMIYDDFKEKILNNNDFNYESYEEFVLERINGVGIYQVTIKIMYNFSMYQEYHFLDKKLVGCTSTLYYSRFVHGLPNNFNYIYIELINHFTGIYGKVKDVFNGNIENTKILSKIPEIVLGNDWEGNVLSIDTKKIDINNDTLFISLKKSYDFADSFPQIGFCYGTDIFYNDFLDILFGRK